MISVYDILQNFIQGVPLEIIVASASHERIQRRTHMKIAICVRRSIVQYKQGAFVIFPLLHGPMSVVRGIARKVQH
jgi:hypothetical protein